MLAVTIDEWLTFEQHIASCAAKASKAMVGVGLLAKSRGGVKAQYVRQLARQLSCRGRRGAWLHGTSREPSQQGPRGSGEGRCPHGDGRIPDDFAHRPRSRSQSLPTQFAPSPSSPSTHSLPRLKSVRLSVSCTLLPRQTCPACQRSPVIHLTFHSFPALLQPHRHARLRRYSLVAH